MSQLVACPECKKHLQVPEDLLGKKVQCPECKHTFVAKAEAEEEEVSKTSTTASPPPPSSKKAAWDKKKADDDDDDDDDRKSKSIKKRPKDDDDDDDGDDDDRRRRKRKRSSSSRRGDYMPHRGGMILAFGLIGLIGGFTGMFFPVVFGILAWIMGNTDLQEMKAGRMDPEGEGMTNAGKIMGIISVVLHILYVVAICGYFACVFVFFAAIIGGAGAAAKQQQQQQNRPPNFP